MNLIQYRLTDKPRFFGLVDVPKEPNEKEFSGDQWKENNARQEYKEAFKLCESKALEIVNPEVLPITFYHNSESGLGAFALNDPYTVLKHNDTFQMPEDVEFGVDLNKTGKVVYRFIRLSKKEGGIIIPNVMTEKNKILSRALTFLSDEEGLGEEIFNELVSLMDKKEEKEPSIEECQTMLYEAFIDLEGLNGPIDCLMFSKITEVRAILKKVLPQLRPIRMAQ